MLSSTNSSFRCFERNGSSTTTDSNNLQFEDDRMITQGEETHNSTRIMLNLSGLVLKENVEWIIKLDREETSPKHNSNSFSSAMTRHFSLSNYSFSNSASSAFLSPSIELKRIIGSGSYSTVYLGWSPELKREFAIKVMEVDEDQFVTLTERQKSFKRKLGRNSDTLLAAEIPSPREEDSIKGLPHHIQREIILHGRAMKNDTGKVLQLFGYSVAKCDEEPSLETLSLETQSNHPNSAEMRKEKEELKSHSKFFIFLILEYCPHPDLFDLTVRHGGFDCESTRQIMLQLIDAVDHCHRNGVFHRDIKPENVFFSHLEIRLSSINDSNASSSSTREEEDEEHFIFPIDVETAEKVRESNSVTIKLGDFGLATDEVHCPDKAVGSLPYMSPEAYNNSSGSYYSPAADVWSLGVIFFSTRFAKTLWSCPDSEEDSNYSTFLFDPMSLKRAFHLTNEAYNLVARMLDPCPETRCSLREARSLLCRIKNFVQIKTSSASVETSSTSSSTAATFQFNQRKNDLENEDSGMEHTSLFMLGKPEGKRKEDDSLDRNAASSRRGNFSNAATSRGTSLASRDEILPSSRAIDIQSKCDTRSRKDSGFISSKSWADLDDDESTGLDGLPNMFASGDSNRYFPFST